MKKTPVQPDNGLLMAWERSGCRHHIKGSWKAPYMACCDIGDAEEAALWRLVCGRFLTAWTKVKPMKANFRSQVKLSSGRGDKDRALRVLHELGRRTAEVNRSAS